MSERQSLSEIDAKEHRMGRLMLRLPYGLLAAAAALSLVQPGSASHRLAILGLSALALGWMLAAYELRSPKWRSNQVAMVVYLVGVLVLCALLMRLDMLFFLYGVTGFLVPFVVLPQRWLGVPIVFATSVVLNFGAADFDDVTFEDASGMFAIVGIQTLMIGLFGYYVGGLQDERQRASKELEETMRENAGLHAQLLTQAREAGVHDERQRLAGEIHDTLAQGLAGIVTQLEAAEQTVERPAEHQRHLGTAARLARDSLAEARRTVHAVRPRQLEDAHLPDALGEVVDGWSSTNGVPVELTTTGTPEPLHPEIEVTLLRVTQEALTNIAKHAEASRVGLTLSYMGDVVTLDVRDDGVGFEPAELAETGRSEPDREPTGGFGLDGMRQRLRRVAGTLEVEAEPGAGTALSARVPTIRPGGTS